MLKTLLKLLVLSAGFIASALGPILIFSQPINGLLGAPTIPAAQEMLGLFMFFNGVLLFFASKDIEKYTLIILVSIGLHFFMPFVDLYLVSLYPQYRLFLMSSLIIDPLWGLTALILLKKCGYIRKGKANQ